MKIYKAPNMLWNFEISNLDRVGTFIPIPSEIPDVRNIKIHTHTFDVTNLGGSLKDEPQNGLYEYEIEGRMY